MGRVLSVLEGLRSAAGAVVPGAPLTKDGLRWAAQRAGYHPGTYRPSGSRVRDADDPGLLADAALAGPVAVAYPYRTPPASIEDVPGLRLDTTLQLRNRSLELDGDRVSVSDPATIMEKYASLARTSGDYRRFTDPVALADLLTQGVSPQAGEWTAEAQGPLRRISASRWSDQGRYVVSDEKGHPLLSAETLEEADEFARSRALEGLAATVTRPASQRTYEVTRCPTTPVHVTIQVRRLTHRVQAAHTGWAFSRTR